MHLIIDNILFYKDIRGIDSGQDEFKGILVISTMLYNLFITSPAQNPDNSG
jgi:hypothetical protein